MPSKCNRGKKEIIQVRDQSRHKHERGEDTDKGRIHDRIRQQRCRQNNRAIGQC